MSGARRARLTTVTALAVALLASACSDDGSPGPTQPDEAPLPRPTVAPGAVPVFADVGGTAAQLEVGPVVRDGELAVLHVRVTGADPEREVRAADLGLANLGEDPDAPDNLRLLDASTLDVRPPAVDGEGVRLASASAATTQAGETLTVVSVHDTPDGDTTSVLVPTVGMVDEVEVVDAADAPDGLPSLGDVLAEAGVSADDVTAPVSAADVVRERSADGALPAADGPEGTVEEGVTVAVPGAGEGGADLEVHVAVDDLRRVGGVVVGTLRATPRAAPAAPVAALFGPGGEGTSAATAVTLLTGGERVHPLAHAAGAGQDPAARHPLADMSLDRVLDPGLALRVTVVWPDPGADEVVVDVAASSGGRDGAAVPWRVTGVPVHSAS